MNSSVSTRREFLTQAAALGTAASIPLALQPASAANATASKSMKTYRIANTDLVVSRIVHGLNRIATRDTDPNSSAVVSAAGKLVGATVDNGINFFEMAAMYGSGMVESVFGNVLKQSPGLRDRIVIQTKCGAVDNPKYAKRGDQPFLFDCSRRNIVESAEGSLKRLGVDRIDLLLLHWPDLLMQPEEVAQAFDSLYRSGKVRYFGVSNHTVGQMELLRKYVRQPLVANQIQLGLGTSYPIAAGLEQLKDWAAELPRGHASLIGVVDHCYLHQMQIQAYSPVYGVLRYKLLDPPADASPQVKNASQILLGMARQKNVSPLALSIAWLLHHPAGIAPVTGAHKPEHIIENCTADSVMLTREEWFTLFFACAAVQAPGVA